MATRHERSVPPPGRLFFGAFTTFERLFDLARERIAVRFGELDPAEESPVFPFPTTRTYAKTMGPGPFFRKFFFLRAPWPRDGLASVKIRSIEIEEEIQRSEPFPVPRAINIDPGLLDEGRIILASTKDRAHRIYRGDGIWEEVTLTFRGGTYESLPWTYPDFRTPEYAAYFAPIRAEYLKTLGDPPLPGQDGE